MPRIAAPIAIAAALAAAGAAQAQSYTPVNLPAVPGALAQVVTSILPELRGVPCPAGGTVDGHNTSPDSEPTCRKPHTLTAVSSFAVVNLEFTQAPPLQYQLASTYAYYAASCAPASLQRPGARPPPGRPLAQVLPRAPVLPGDTSITINLSTPIGLSLYAPRWAQPKGMPPAPTPLGSAFGLAMAQGNGYVQASQPVLAQGLPPTLGGGVIVLAVAASYRLANASYGAFVVPADVVIDKTTKLVLPMLGGVAVVGQMSGGSWGQGSGLLFIPAPNAMAPTQCDHGAFVAPAPASVVGLFGIFADRPFAPPPGSVFVRTSGG